MVKKFLIICLLLVPFPAMAFTVTLGKGATFGQKIAFGNVLPPVAAGLTHLRTYDNASYIYDPVDQFPPGGCTLSPCYVHVTGGPGWTVSSMKVDGFVDGFTTADGVQNLWFINPGPQTTPDLSGGLYYVDSNP